MNIKFGEWAVATELARASIDSTIVGSHLYGTNTNDSDMDWLIVYAEKDTLYETQHQLQYVTNEGNDFMYTSLKKLINNILSGDQTIVYEAAFNFSGNLAWLSDFANQGMFDNYKVINAYLGFAKRDIKNFRKKKSEKKLFHISRGVRTAQRLLGECPMDNERILALAKKEAQTTDDKTGRQLISNYESLVKRLKTMLNVKLDAGNIALTISNKNAKILETKYEEFINSKEYISKILKIDTSELFYEFQFNGAKY